MTAQRIPYYVVDAFTDTPFGGNPAAICLDIGALSDVDMLRVAGEMNLSETAFVYAPGSDRFRRLRWFTPTTEVPLCGHATLASAHVIIRELGGTGPVRFKTASGPLTVFDQGKDGLRMDFPSDPPRATDTPPGLEEALGLPAGSGRYLAAQNLALLVLDTASAVFALTPDYSALSRVELGPGLMGVSVTSAGDPSDADFVSRFFAPWTGVDEDPVTGVAHTVLTPFWTGELGKAEMTARQGLDRGGSLVVRQRESRVDLIGQATTVAHGRMALPGVD